METNLTLPALPKVPVTDPPVPLPAGMTLVPLAKRPVAGGGEAHARSVKVPMHAEREFWKRWHSRKRDFLLRGFTIIKDNGGWVLQQWLSGGPGNYTLTPNGAAKLERAQSPPADFLPLPEAPPVILDLPPLPHGLEEKLYDYQRQPARQLYRALMHGKTEWGFSGAWCCDDLGTGKTYTGLAAAVATGKEVAIVCPKAIIGTFPKMGNKGAGWRGAFAHFKQIPAFILNYESLRTGNREWIKKTGNRQRAFEWTMNPEDIMLIFDEAHNLKNPSLNRSMAFAAIRQGFSCLFVSGTMAAAPNNLAATGAAVGLHDMSKEGYERFLVQYGCQNLGGSWWFPKGRAAAVHLAKIHRLVFPCRGSRIRTAELGDRFPETQILCEAVETDATAAIAAAWREANATIQQLENQGASEGRIKLMQSTAYMDAWHRSERAKIGVIVEMVEREKEEGRSVAIFVNFTDVREELMRQLKTSCSIFGGQNQPARDKCIADFQEDRSRVIVCNTKAGGVGVSLHDVNGDFPRTAIILPTNNAVDIGQALGRVHRAGGKSRSRQVVLFAADTIEEEICASTRAKLSAIATLNDGDLRPVSKF